MTPCQRYKDKIMELFDGELDALQSKAVNQHLKTCDSCSAFMTQLQTLRTRMQSLTPIETSEHFHLVLRDQIRREMSGRRSHFELFSSRRWIPAVGLASVIAVSLVMISDHRNMPWSKAQGSARPMISQSTPAPAARRSGSIQYVVGEYPDRLSVERRDERPAGLSRSDSLEPRQDPSLYRQRLTPVSF